jgi:predicted transcriptional regulator
MGDQGRVVTAKLPTELAIRLDEMAGRMDRTRSWIIKQAVAQWLVEEERFFQLTLEALKSMDDGRTFTQEEVEMIVKRRTREGHEPSCQPR